MKSHKFEKCPVIADTIWNKRQNILHKLQPPVKFDERFTLFVSLKLFSDKKVGIPTYYDVCFQLKYNVTYTCV